MFLIFHKFFYMWKIRNIIKSYPNLHACILNDVPNLPHVKKLVQSDFLDFCLEEVSSWREQNIVFPTFLMRSYNLNFWWYLLAPTLRGNYKLPNRGCLCEFRS